MAQLAESQVKSKTDSDGKVNAVRGVSFGVKPGEIFSLLGVNGAGKSSTFNCLVGVERMSGGTVEMVDTDGDSIY